MMKHVMLKLIHTLFLSTILIVYFYIWFVHLWIMYLQKPLMVVGLSGLMVHAPSIVEEKVCEWILGHVTIPLLRTGARTAMARPIEHNLASPAHVSIHVHLCYICSAI